jgi:hypothetical protein
MQCLRFTVAVAIVLGLASISLAKRSQSQVAAAQGFTFQGIGFKDKKSRSRETFTDKFPEAGGGQKKINDQGKKSYEVTLSDKRILRARYYDGILYELEIVGPRLQSSYKKLARKFGEPDTAGGYGRSFKWKLDNIRVSLQVDREKEVVAYHDTKYREAAAKMNNLKK